MSRPHPVRHYPRWPTCWPMLYGNEEFVAKGTVLAIRGMTPHRWHAQGPMPVHPWMRLTIWVWPPEMPEGLHVGNATVLWVKGYEFGLEVQDLDPVDQEALTPFLDRAMGWWVVPRAA